MDRRRFLRTAGAAAGLPLLGACGFGGAVQQGRSEAEKLSGRFDWKKYDGSTIKLLLNKHPYTDALKMHLPDFKKKTGIDVQIDEFPEQNYFDKVTLELKSRQGNYDAFMLGAYMVWRYGPPGYLEDLRPWMDNKAATAPEWEQEDFYPNVFKAGQWNFNNGDPLGSGNSQWMLPWGFETNTVCYRKDVFDKLGVKPAETFDELVELASTITKKAPDGMYGIAVRGTREWATIHPGFMTMYSREGLSDFKVESGNRLFAEVNTPKAVEFTDKWVNMVRDSGPAGWTSYTWYAASSDLGAGKTAMLFDADIAAYFQNEGTPAAGKLAWHPGPKGPDGSLATNMWIWSLAINSASKQKGPAWWLLQWATSREHLFWGGTKAQHINTVRKSVAEEPAYRKRLASARDFIDTYDQVIDECAIQFTPERNFLDATTSWASALQEIYGGDDTKSTLDSLKSQMDDRVNV